MPAGVAGVTKLRAVGQSNPLSRAGGAGLVGLGAADRRPSQGGGYDTGAELMARGYRYH
jgi:hypothetical protein